jgi:hypothetical protein
MPTFKPLPQTPPDYAYQTKGLSHPKPFYRNWLARMVTFFSLPSEELSHYDGTIGRKGYYNYRFLIK